MIRLALKKDILFLARMLRRMYLELQPTAVRDLAVYIKVIEGHIDNPKEYVYIDDNYKGFFIIRDETEPMVPSRKMYNGIRVYILPIARKTSILSKFYKRLFKDFPDGEIFGFTEINSEHIKVLDKRHTLIAKVYKLNRSI